MAYHWSSIDTSILSWFQSDPTASSLRKIEIASGRIRGLGKVEVPFDFPIVSIAGPNGCGKSTLLALAACAYHSTPEAFNPFGRGKPYYTFADFFIQSVGEPQISGAIRYQFYHNNWRAKPGQVIAPLNWQIRKKGHGGRWTNYDSRVRRNVAYLGINRMVPEYEEPVLRTYHRMFNAGAPLGWEAAVMQSVGSVLGKPYALMDYLRYRTHRVPRLQLGSAVYSGFNMGAGESALIELFATIYSCNGPLLLVVDEIELGLHEEAQVRLVRELKAVCKQRKLQVISTTHSAAILSALPPDGRVFLEPHAASVAVLPGVTPEYATGRLAGRTIPEMDILVEDDVAAAVIQTALSASTRSRLRIVPVGSHTAVMRHLAVRVTERTERPACAILDGDRRQDAEVSLNTFAKAFEGSTAAQEVPRKDWARARLTFTPGAAWPELWILDALVGAGSDVLDDEFGLAPGQREMLWSRARAAGKHNEFFQLAQDLGAAPEIVRHRLCVLAMQQRPEERATIVDFVGGQLGMVPTFPP